MCALGRRKKGNRVVVFLVLGLVGFLGFFLVGFFGSHSSLQFNSESIPQTDL